MKGCPNRLISYSRASNTHHLVFLAFPPSSARRTTTRRADSTSLSERTTMYATTRTTTTATAVSATRAVSIKVCTFFFFCKSDPLTRGRGRSMTASHRIETPWMESAGCVARAREREGECVRVRVRDGDGDDRGMDGTVDVKHFVSVRRWRRPRRRRASGSSGARDVVEGGRRKTLLGEGGLGAGCANAASD